MQDTRESAGRYADTIQGPSVGPRDADRRLRFTAGITLIAVSFLVYPAYVVIPFLSVPDTKKLGITLLASLLSWGIFCAGFYLSGREGYAWLRRRLKP